MSSGKMKDFYGKEVTDAIKEACASLRVPQEELEIEVVEIGSMGVFGLIRKKAHIRAMVKVVATEKEEKAQEDIPVVPEPAPESVGEEPVSEPIAEAVKKAEKKPEKPAKKPAKKPAETPVEKPAEKPVEGKPEDKVKEKAEPGDDSKVTQPKSKPRAPQKAPVEIQAESVETVRQELSELLRLMGFPSEVTAELDGSTVRCQVNGEHEEALTGQEGKIIDSLQYILRKLITRKIEEKVRLSIDVGAFREKRREELMERARELAALVKEDGKTQAIPPLNPSERRIVHVALQDDKEIRSRSVGDGLFKKILIYKPGKGKKAGNSKRPAGKGQRGRGNKPEGDADS